VVEHLHSKHEFLSSTLIPPLPKKKRKRKRKEDKRKRAVSLYTVEKWNNIYNVWNWFFSVGILEFCFFFFVIPEFELRAPCLLGSTLPLEPLCQSYFLDFDFSFAPTIESVVSEFSVNFFAPFQSKHYLRKRVLFIKSLL
jgi:hypothetical protein